MSRPDDDGYIQRFVPPAAQLAAATGIIAIVFGIGVTTLAWLFFENSSPLIALVCGAFGSAICLWLDRWRRRRTGPPAIEFQANAVVIEGAGQRITIPWADITEVRHVDREIESIEIVNRSGSGSLVVIDNFSREQAEEIRRQLLARAS